MTNKQEKPKKIYKKNFIGLTANVIPYHKKFRAITGSVTSAILWQQLEYWFERKQGKEFFKFLEPLKEEKGGYKKGDSWSEELGFSALEFRTAFSKIGTAYKSKKEYNESKDKFKDKMYCSYFDKISRQTWYYRNEKMINDNIDKLIAQSIEMNNPNPPRCGNPIPRDAETQSRYTRDYSRDYYRYLFRIFSKFWK